jgi:hypothetical protein
MVVEEAYREWESLWKEEKTVGFSKLWKSGIEGEMD